MADIFDKLQPDTSQQTVKTDIFDEAQQSEQTISQAKPTSTIEQLIGIAQNRGMSIPEKIRQVESTMFPKSPDEQIAEAGNMFAISNVTGIPMEKLSANNKQLYNGLVRSPEVTGIKPDLNQAQFNTVAFTPGIIASAIVNPIGTAVGLGGYALLDKLLPPEKFISSDMNESAKATFELADMIAKGGIASEGQGELSKALRFTMTKMAKPQLAQAIRFLTGTIPQSAAERAIQNPDILSPQILAKEGAEAGAEYKRVIDPLRRNKDAVVDLKDTNAVIKNENIKLGQGDYSSEIHKMTKPEAQKVIDWVDWVDFRSRSGHPPNYNEVEGKINEVDMALGKFYRKENRGKVTTVEPVSTSFERLASIIRGSLSDSLKAQFPEVQPVIERYHNYILDREAANHFKGLNASFFKAMPVKFSLLALGMTTKGALLPAYLSTMPAFWKKLLTTANRVGKGMELFPEQIKSTFRGEGTTVPPLFKPYMQQPEE
jgi:hypothetical protein